jgi:Flp pilus assembly protein TadB
MPGQNTPGISETAVLRWDVALERSGCIRSKRILLATHTPLLTQQQFDERHRLLSDAFADAARPTRTTSAINILSLFLLAISVINVILLLMRILSTLVFVWVAVGIYVFLQVLTFVMVIQYEKKVIIITVRLITFCRRFWT